MHDMGNNVMGRMSAESQGLTFCWRAVSLNSRLTQEMLTHVENMAGQQECMVGYCRVDCINY